MILSLQVMNRTRYNSNILTVHVQISTFFLHHKLIRDFGVPSFPWDFASRKLLFSLTKEFSVNESSGIEKIGDAEYKPP